MTRAQGSGHVGRWSASWRTARTAAVIVAAASLTGVSADVAALAQPQAKRSATVVKIVKRHPFGRMLATVHGRSLYIKPRGRCTGQCLAIWPPLLMPKGKTMPLGARCLGTARFRLRRQVTYRGKRLYLFVSDRGRSVRGNGVGGFVVAKVRRRACR